MSDRSRKESGNTIVKGARNTTLTQGVFSLSKSAIGAGALTLAFCFARLGSLAGSLVLIFASIATTIPLHFLSRIAANTDLSSYFAIGNLAFGSFGQLSAMIALILFIIGALIFYIVRAAGFMISFLEYFVMTSNLNAPWYLQKGFMMLFIVILMFPVACMRDMSVLGKTSIVGMICMFYVLGLTIVDYFVDNTIVAEAPAVVSFGIGTFSSIFSDLLFAFVNHFTMVSVVPAMIDPTPRRRAKLTGYSAGIILIFYLAISLFGYLHFGTSATENILDNRQILTYTIGKFMVAIMLILSYPLLLDPCRGTIEGALALISPSFKKPSFVRNLIITAVLMAISALVGYFGPEYAGYILRATTAFSGSLMVFIFPSLYFLKLGDRYKIHAAERISAYCLIAFGAAFMGLGTYFGVSSIIEELSKKV